MGRGVLPTPTGPQVTQSALDLLCLGHHLPSGLPSQSPGHPRPWPFPGSQQALQLPAKACRAPMGDMCLGPTQTTAPG